MSNNLLARWSLAIWVVSFASALTCYGQTPGTVPPSAEAPPSVNNPPAEGTAGSDTSDVVMANNAFALDLYSRLANQPGNLFFSPYSIESALAMTSAGARGQTAEQMSQVLHLRGAPEAVHGGFAALMHNLNAGQHSTEESLHDVMKEGVPYQLFVANSLWCQQGYPFRDDFLKIAHDQYGASPNQVDFAREAESARQQINAWVARQTQDKIENLVPPKTIDSSTRLVLADAIYFKGHWHVEFDKSKTQAKPFHVGSNQSTSASMMNVQDDLGYAEAPDLQILELPYFAQQMSLVILLPKQVDGLLKLERSLSPARISQFLGQMQSRQVNVFLPKFKLTSEFNLGDTLQAMGMTEAFSPQADFSGISTSSSLYIGFVLHKAYVNVDEEGTEAAAATAIGMMMGIMRPPPPPIVFRADHPFLLLIRHNQTGTILFMGRLTSP